MTERTRDGDYDELDAGYPQPAPADPEAAYRAGWSACMAWSDRQPPAALSAEDAAVWLDGFDDATDSPLGSGPDVTDLMRACPVFRTITGAK